MTLQKQFLQFSWVSLINTKIIIKNPGTCGHVTGELLIFELLFSADHGITKSKMDQNCSFGLFFTSPVAQLNTFITKTGT